MSTEAPSVFGPAALAVVLGCILAASPGCSSEQGSTAGTDGAGAGTGAGGAPGMCGEQVPSGQACNTIANVGSVVTPTCSTGTPPTGTGGAVVDGTYVLTSMTIFSGPSCSITPLSATIAVAGGCVQAVDSVPQLLTMTGSSTFTVQGNTITVTQTCLDSSLDAGAYRRDTPTESFTATDTTLTLLVLNSAVGNPNPDRIEIYAKP